MSGFLGQNTSVMYLNAVTPIYAMLGRGWFLSMIKPDDLVVLFDPSISGMPGLCIVDLHTLVGML